MPRHREGESPNFKPFVTYDAEGDSFTLHFRMAKEIGAPVVPCLRCGQTMAGYVGTLGICTGGPREGDGKGCNEKLFPYLEIRNKLGYIDHEVTAKQLQETYENAIKYLMDIERPLDEGFDDWNVDGLNELIRLIDEALVERSTVRAVTRPDVPVCAQCGFKEPCSCAAFSQQEVTQCQDTTQAAVATAVLPAGGTRTTGPTTRSRSAAKATAAGASR